MRIFYGGPIITMDEEQPIIEAVGIEGEKIKAVGALEDVKQKMGDNLDLIDLKGNSLLPGFIDCHMHPISYIILLLNFDLSNVKNLKELQGILKEAADSKPKGEIIFGLRLKEEEFEVPRLPTRWDLDEVCPEHPVFLIRYDGHIGIVNTKTLQLINVDSGTIAPEGGEIRKNKNGEITGIISENALDMFYSKLLKYILPKLEVLKEYSERTFKFFAKLIPEFCTVIDQIPCKKFFARGYLNELSIG